MWHINLRMLRKFYDFFLFLALLNENAYAHIHNVRGREFYVALNVKLPLQSSICLPPSLED